MASPSQHVGSLQIRGLNKLGDVLAPGTEDLPSFSRSGAAAEADRIFDYMPASDLKDLNLLLTIMGLVPMIVVRGFVGFLEKSERIPGGVGAFLRFARIGIRGLVMSLYWGHPRVHAVIGYDVSVYTEDL